MGGGQEPFGQINQLQFLRSGINRDLVAVDRLGCAGLTPLDLGWLEVHLALVARFVEAYSHLERTGNRSVSKMGKVETVCDMDLPSLKREIATTK